MWQPALRCPHSRLYLGGKRVELVMFLLRRVASWAGGHLQVPGTCPERPALFWTDLKPQGLVRILQVTEDLQLHPQTSLGLGLL